MSGTEDSLFPDEPEEDAGPAPWRPVWEDDEAAADPAVPPWITPTRARSLQRREPDWRALLAPLAAAEDTLSRLEAGAESASPAVREGLVARLAFAEAAGWLAAAADRAWIHPRDLALAEAGLLGDFAAAALGGRGWPERFAAWRSAVLVLPRPGQPPGLPPLLTTATAAATWLTAEALEDTTPTPAQVLLLAAAVARRRGRL